MRVVVRTAIVSVLVGGVSGVACGLEEDGRDGVGPGIPGADDEPPVSFIEEEDYGPVAQYLAANANYPLGQDGNDGGGADEGGGADDGGGGADDGGAGDGASCSGFACNSGECIDASWKCDEIVDCPGGEDEANCPSSGDGGDAGDGGTQPCDGFQCNDGTCIISEWKCDQYNDCAGGEDEAGCPSSDGGDGGDDGTCDGFECNDGTCIESSWVCDELVDCQGGEDESGCQIAPDGPVGLDPDFAAANDTQAVSGSCLATWTTAGATTGSLAAKAATTSCTGGGVLLGFVSGGTTLGAAAVCFVGNVTNADVIAGGVFGALSGLTGGLIFCEGGALDLATSAIKDLVDSKPVPVYKVEPKDKACDPCPVPATPPEPDRVDCVPPSKVHWPCKSHHWHVYSWQVNQNPETCECHNNKREEVLCYDPVGDPDTANDPLWNVCL